MDYFHSRDLRTGRFSEPERPYLVTTTTLHRTPVFSEITAARLLAKELRDAEEAGCVSSLCWVIMPDHLHWLLVLQRAALHKVVRRVKSRSAIAINRARNRTGKLWQPGFHDRALRRNEDIKRVARYVIANPLRAGLVSDINDYPLWEAVWVDRGH